MHVTTTTVPADFRSTVAAHMPGINKDQAYWRLFGHLAFPTWVDEDTYQPILSSELLARLEGKQRAHASKNYVAEAFLQAYQEDVHDLTWSDGDYKKGKARVLESCAMPAPVREAVAALKELQAEPFANAPAVYLHSGRAVSPKGRMHERETAQLAAFERMAAAGCSESRDLLDYLNRLDPHRFTKILTNYPEAVRVAQAVENPRSRDVQLNLLRAIADQPQPFYGPAGNTVRVFGVNASILGLKKSVRRALCPGWIEADLRACQLAICAAKWGVPEIQDLLRSGRSVWTHLSDELAIPLDPATKQYLKRALYSVAYGMSSKNLRANVDGWLGEGVGQAFLRCDLIACLLEARRRRQRQIRRDGGAFNCYGTWIAPHEEGLLSVPTLNTRSVLAQCAQALELHLIHPVIQMARENRTTHGFSVLLWQHDGFSFVSHTANETERWAHWVRMVVDERARQLGIDTALEMEEG